MSGLGGTEMILIGLAILLLFGGLVHQSIFIVKMNPNDFANRENSNRFATNKNEHENLFLLSFKIHYERTLQDCIHTLTFHFSGIAKFTSSRRSCCKQTI